MYSRIAITIWPVSVFGLYLLGYTIHLGHSSLSNILIRFHSTPPHSQISPQTKSSTYRRQSFQEIINARRCKECATSPRRKNWYALGEEKPYVRALRTPQPQRLGSLNLVTGYNQELFAGKFDGDLGNGVRGFGTPPETRGAVKRRGIQGLHEVPFGVSGSVTSKDRISARINSQPSLSTSLPDVAFEFGNAAGSAFYRPIISPFHKPCRQQEQLASANQLFLDNPSATPKSHDGLPQPSTKDTSVRTRKASPPIKQETSLAPHPVAISEPTPKLKSQKDEHSNSVIPTQDVF